LNAAEGTQRGKKKKGSSLSLIQTLRKVPRRKGKKKKEGAWRSSAFTKNRAKRGGGEGNVFAYLE